LYDRLTSLVERGCDAVVVTQGTDTLEETSYALDLLWARDEPVVFTGAMRNPLRTGSDGPANCSPRSKSVPGPPLGVVACSWS